MRTLRQLVLVVFILALFAPWEASAAGARPMRQSPPNVEVSATDLLSRAWDALVRLWTKNGCSADPDGSCAPAVTRGDNGCVIDPNGRCAPQVNNGCGADPNGNCAPAVIQAKNGCSADPSGHCGS